MTAGNDRRDDLTLEESRYLDGTLPPAEARRLEHKLAADPERAAHLAAYREAMELWREDARRTAASLAATEASGAESMADRVLAAVAEGRADASQTPSVRWYAVAALLLTSIGLGGTILLRADRARAATPRPELGGIADALFDSTITSPALANLAGPGADARGG